MSDDSRILEQRIEAAITVIGDVDMTYDVLERAGLPSLLAERDAALERAETAEARMERVREGGWHAGMIQGEKERWALQVERDAALERAERAEAGIDDEVDALRVAWMVAKRDLTTAEAERDAAQAAAEEMREALESDEPALCPLVRAERAEAAAREMAKAMQTAIDAMPDFYWSEASVRGIVECVVAMKRILAAHPDFLEEGS